MAGQDYLGLQTLGARDRCVKIFHLEPKEHAVAGRHTGIADWSVMMSYFPVVQLKNQPIVPHEAFVIRAPMGALAAKKLLIPPARRFDISRADKGLWTHDSQSAAGLDLRKVFSRNEQRL